MWIFRRYELVIGFLLGLALCAVAAIYSPNHQQNYKADSTTHGEPARVSTDERLADYTLWLAILTGVLALSTIGLWVVTWRAGIRQSSDMQASLALARQEFISTYRPKLVVRELVMLEPEADESPIKVRYVVANIGSGNAEIVESWVEVQYSRDRRLWPLQPTEGANPIGTVTLNPGTSIFREQGSAAAKGTLAHVWRIHGTTPYTPVQTVFFRGFIIYRAGNHVQRKTGFCRVWNWETRRFDLWNDPDYEYAD